MNRRERILTTINHLKPDRVPIGFDIVSPEKEQEIYHFYGVNNRAGLYQKTGIDCFSVWHSDHAALPEYCGPKRPGLESLDSTYGFWGKVSEKIYPLAATQLNAYHWPQWDEFDYSRLAGSLLEIRQHDLPAASGHAGPGWLHHVQMRGYDHALMDVLDDIWMEEYIARNREFFIPYFETSLKMQMGRLTSSVPMRILEGMIAC